MASFVVIYDACVLYPAPLRDMLLRLARAGLVRARWTDRIIEECFRSILAKRPDLNPAAISRTRALINQSVPDCLVTGYEGLVDNLTLPDPNDRHVLAAAIRAGAQAIVTFNLADFPEDRLAPYDLEALHPDDFVMSAIDLGAGSVIKVVSEQAAALKSPPLSINDLLGILQRAGLAQSVARLRSMFRPLSPLAS